MDVQLGSAARRRMQPDAHSHRALNVSYPHGGSATRLQVVFGGINASKVALDDLAVLQASAHACQPLPAPC